MNDLAWLCVENIIAMICIVLLYWISGSGWIFLLLLCLNNTGGYCRRLNKCQENECKNS